MLYWPMPNVLYVEGHGLDAFARGEWALRPVHQNRIGVALDSAIEPDLRLRHIQVADAAQATLGLDIAGVVVTGEPLGVEKWIDEETGQSTGRLGNPDALLDAVRHLVRECGADAVAVVGRFPDDAEEELVEYRQGQVRKQGSRFLILLSSLVAYLLLTQGARPLLAYLLTQGARHAFKN